MGSYKADVIGNLGVQQGGSSLWARGERGHPTRGTGREGRLKAKGLIGAESLAGGPPSAEKHLLFAKAD